MWNKKYFTTLATWKWRQSFVSFDSTYSVTYVIFSYAFDLKDEEGRCYIDSFTELPERDPDEDLETSKQKE